MNYLVNGLKFIGRCSLLLLAVGLLMRTILLFACHQDITTGTTSDCLLALMIGVWFDAVMAAYCMLPPLVILAISALIGKAYKVTSTAVFALSAITSTLFIAASSSNIPFFAYYFHNLNSGIFQWLGYSTTIVMLISEVSYIGYILLGLSAIAAAIYIIHRWLKVWQGAIKRQPNDTFDWKILIRKFAVSAVALLACAAIMRGRMGYNPIKVSAAYFCSDPFLNQLGINPAFNLMTSAMDDMRRENRTINVATDSESAMQHTMQMLCAADSTLIRHNTSPDSLMRSVATSSTHADRPNVVMILMESMSARLLTQYGGPQITPFLDSLSKVSISAKRFYSAGNHTNHGIFASLYSIPTILERNAMKSTVTRHVSGLPQELQRRGYHTSFYMSHESQYDNMNAFLRTNGYTTIRSQEDYPSEKVVNSFGVQDDYLLSYAAQELITSDDTIPQFATILTISNHPPYVIPEWFHASCRENDEIAIVEYADHCLEMFFAEIKQWKGYDNTIFVLLGDHGKRFGRPECDVQLSMNTIPLIIHSPLLDTYAIECPGSQVDIMPTILGILGGDYEYSGFGQDLLHNPRHEAYFSSDNHLIGVTRDSLCIISPHENIAKSYVGLDSLNLRPANDDTHSSLERNLRDYMQTAETVYQRLPK